MKIYHLKEMNIESYLKTRYGGTEAALRAWSEGEYNLVAEVATEDLEEAFVKTNSIDAFWGENEGVQLTNPGEGCRSSSVGDIFQNDEGFFLVEAIGFEKIDIPTSRAKPKA